MKEEFNYAELESLLLGVTDPANTQNPQKILGLLKELDVYYSKNRNKLPRKIRHYLKGRSYVKAIQFIRTGDAPCGKG